MLKENYDSGSSNPSSYKTGKKTLKERINRKLGDSQYGGDCKHSYIHFYKLFGVNHTNFYF